MAMQGVSFLTDETETDLQRVEKIWNRGTHEGRDALIFCLGNTFDAAGKKMDRATRDAKIAEMRARINQYLLLDQHPCLGRFFSGSKIRNTYACAIEASGAGLKNFWTERLATGQSRDYKIVTTWMTHLIKGLSHIHRMTCVHTSLHDLDSSYVVSRLGNTPQYESYVVKISIRDCYLVGDDDSVRIDGVSYTRETNIYNLRFPFIYLLTGLEMVAKDVGIGHIILRERKHEALHFIKYCSDKNNIPQLGDLLRHPLFWTVETRMQFLVDVNERSRVRAYDTTQKTYVGPLLNRPLHDALWRLLPESNVDGSNMNWRDTLGTDVADDMAHTSNYNWLNFSFLLDGIRNQDAHMGKNQFRRAYAEYSPLGSNVREGLDKFLESKYPDFFIKVYEIARSNIKQSDALFGGYFGTAHVPTL